MIYKIITPNNEIYIGRQKVDGQHADYFCSSVLIKRAIKKGNYKKEDCEKVFAFDDPVDKIEADRLERMFIKHYRKLVKLGRFMKCLNIADGGTGGDYLGHKGSKQTEETKKKIAEANKRRVLSKETREKMSQSQKRRFQEKGVSEETRKKLSKSLKGKKQNKTEAGKLTVSKAVAEANRKRVWTDEMREHSRKASTGRKGFIATDEMRARMSRAQKLRFKKQREKHG